MANEFGLKSSLDKLLSFSSSQMDSNQWESVADELIKFDVDLCAISNTEFMRVLCNKLKTDLNEPMIQILILLFQHEMLVEQL